MHITSAIRKSDVIYERVQPDWIICVAPELGFSTGEVLDDFSQADVATGQEPDEPDHEEDDVPDNPHVVEALIGPEGDGVDDGGCHKGQGWGTDGADQGDEQVQTRNCSTESNWKKIVSTIINHTWSKGRSVKSISIPDGNVVSSNSGFLDNLLDHTDQ